MGKETKFWRMARSTTGNSKMARSTDTVFTYGLINHNIRVSGGTMSSRVKVNICGVTGGSTSANSNETSLTEKAL